MWTVETSGIPGLYDVYDEDGNRVVRHTTHERACLVAAAPNMQAALVQIMDLARSGDNRTRMTQLQACRFLDALLIIAALPLKQACGPTLKASERRQVMAEKRFMFMLCFGCMTGHVHELKEDGWWYCPNCGHKRHTQPSDQVENTEGVMTRYFITVEWCNNGFRGVFCSKGGVAAAKDGEPHTFEEMDDILGPFSLILHPQSQEMSEADLAQYTCFVPLAEYSHEWGIALTAEDYELWWQRTLEESAKEVAE